MWLLSIDIDWLQQNTFFGNGAWRCKTDACVIQKVIIPRVVIPSLTSNDGEVVDVAHIFCPRCQDKPSVVPRTQICKDEIEEVEIVIKV